MQEEYYQRAVQVGILGSAMALDEEHPTPGAEFFLDEAKTMIMNTPELASTVFFLGAGWKGTHPLLR